MKEMVRRAIALARYGALTREVFGKPRGTRTKAASRKEPVPGHYYPGTSAWFIVLDEPLHLETYLEAMQTSNIDDDLRRTAVNVVGEFGDDTCVAPLDTVLNARDSQDHATRRRAAHALASIGGEDAEASLWRALESTTCPLTVRTAALMSLLDLLTPDGWNNYNFMNSTRAALPADVRMRLLALRDDALYITEILSQFAWEEAA